MTAQTDNRKVEAAAKRARRKASRELVAAHNARVMTERAATQAAVIAHEAQWGVDGYECA